MFGADHTKALIEINQGSRSKYEIDKETGFLTLDRELLMPYPANYGFIPKTFSYDGDALDIFVVSHYPINPLTVVRYDVVGLVLMTDRGVIDNKILAKLPGYNGKIPIDEIEFFLTKYKTGVDIMDIIISPEEAELEIELARGMYENIK